jgi:hypothetical protein
VSCYELACPGPCPGHSGISWAISRRLSCLSCKARQRGCNGKPGALLSTVRGSRTLWPGSAVHSIRS